MIHCRKKNADLRTNLYYANVEIDNLKTRMAQFESPLDKLTTAVRSDHVVKVTTAQNGSQRSVN